ncbi:hypothetical protein BH24CHL5_BH24CHL5_09880 [soil metagenome]
MNRADRLASSVLFAAATAAWVAVAYVLTTLDPRRDASALLTGALLLGAAVALTLAPLLWLAVFVRNRRIAYRADWWRATRRAALVGLVVVVFVILRSQEALSLPLALFVAAMAVLVEVTLSLRR